MIQIKRKKDDRRIRRATIRGWRRAGVGAMRRPGQGCRRGAITQRAVAVSAVIGAGKPAGIPCRKPRARCLGTPTIAKKNAEPEFRVFPFPCPRECRQAGILNLDSVGSLSSRIRYARHVGHTQQQFRWSATDANKHWSKESMTLTNTAGNSLEGWEELYVPVTPRFAAASAPPQVPPP